MSSGHGARPESPKHVLAGPLLVVTGIWPTPDKPSAGIFVRRRLDGIAASVVGPTSYRGAMPIRYLRLLWSALTVRGRFVGVEGHVLFPAGIIALLAARLRRTPLVIYAHGADVRDTSRENRVYRWLATLVARSAAVVVTNSQATAELIAELGATATVIPPGVDLARFRASPRPSSPRVLYLGGAEPHKGPEIARVIAHTVVGPGIRLIDPDEVPELMSAHDIVLVPSWAEPFGLVAAEAIASGRWVVARDIDGLREVVTDGVNGTLVADNDFAGAIKRVPEYDPQVVAETADRFSWDRHRDRMLELWSRLA